MLRYTNRIKDLGIRFSRSGQLDTCTFSDSYWAGDTRDFELTSGYLYTMAGKAIERCSRKQSVVAMSTCVAEYISLSEACRDVLWRRPLLMGIVGSSETGITVFNYSQIAIKLTENEEIHQQNKCIDKRFHFVCDVVSCTEVLLEYKRITRVVADVVTKPLRQAVFNNALNHQGHRARIESSNLINGQCWWKLQYIYNCDQFNIF